MEYIRFVTDFVCIILQIFSAGGTNPAADWKVTGNVQRCYDKNVRGCVSLFGANGFATFESGTKRPSWMRCFVERGTDQTSAAHEGWGLRGLL